jgi:hypothetical protein
LTKLKENAWADQMSSLRLVPFGEAN